MFPFGPYGYGNPAAMGGAGFDPDAAAYFAAAGITDATEKSAWNECVIALKDFSLWGGSKLRRIYPYLGTTANQQKYDAISLTPGTFAGSMTHNANGITGDGSTAGFASDLTGDDFLSSSVSIGLYSRTAATDGGKDVACGTVFLDIRFSDGNLYSDLPSVTSRNSVASASGVGLFTSCRTSLTSHKTYKNGVLLATETTAVADIGFGAEAIGFLYRTTGADYSSRNHALGFLAYGLDDTDNTNLSTAVSTFLTAIGR